MAENVLELQHICKGFPGVKALQDVSFCVKRGEILGLVGENGAGKSTLMKILTGVYRMDSGKILMDGREIHVTSPLEAQKLGLSIIFQEFNLINTLSIAENLYLGRLKKRGVRGIAWGEIRSDAVRLLEKVGLKADPDTLVGRLSVAGKQMVEIAKALSFDSKVIIMDEPSATLTNQELEKLFRLIENLKKEGITVIYISHRLDEIFSLCDRVTVLRDGMVIDTRLSGEFTRESIISLMIGRQMNQEYPSRKGGASRETVLKVERLTRKGAFEDITFELHRGEILGLAGLVGAGRTEVVRALFGADSLDSGSIYKNGAKININSPRDAIEQGIALVPEDRKTQGLVLDADIRENMTLASLHKVSRTGFLSGKLEREAAEEYVNRLRTKTPGTKEKSVNLSGGNQQKVVLGKWLFRDADILILDEPTRGIDVGAKYEIYQIIFQLVEEGKSIILISSEMPEVLNLSNRILVMREGRLRAELSETEMTPEMVMKYAVMEDK